MCSLMFCFFILTLAFNPYLAQDEVKTLPGLSSALNFSHYSGYLNGSNTRKLHYWFVESQNSPTKDPLVIWMNGGPGCSSLDGLLSELGPFHIKNKKGEVYLNEFSWNKVANIIFLEAPAGVGFSYDQNNEYAFTDDEVSYDNYLALQHFYKKYPQFYKNPLYITGESYGGIYVPTLTKRIAENMGTNGINLKGFAIGNGLLSVSLNDQSIVYFAYNHGLIGEKLWKGLNDNCCASSVCNFNAPKTTECQNEVRAVMEIIFDIGLNEYSLYRPCEKSPEYRSQLYRRLMGLSSSPPRANASTRLYDRSGTTYALPDFEYSEGGSYDIGTNEVDGPKPNLKESVPCLDSTLITDWLNRKDVREALHIPPELGKWDVCSAVVNQNYRRLYDDMYQQFNFLHDAGIRGLVYNGDTDMVCNFLGAQWFVAMLNRTQKGDRSAWYYDKQVGGFVDYYDKLTFATVKGAGHMVPQWRAGPALHMISKFLSGSPF